MSSFEDVIAELGGITEVSKLTARSRTAVCNWRAAGLFPAAQYPTIQDALAELDPSPCTADRSLFTFAEGIAPPIRDRAVCA